MGTGNEKCPPDGACCLVGTMCKSITVRCGFTGPETGSCGGWKRVHLLPVTEDFMGGGVGGTQALIANI